MPRPLIPWLVLALVLGALFAWWMAGGERGTSAVDPVERPPASRAPVGATRLQGAIDAAASRSAESDTVRAEDAPAPVTASRVLRGVVVDLDGEPVSGARVFLLPKVPPDSAGEPNDDPPHTTSDANGAWTLGKVAGAGTWIGAVAEGYLPAHLDGDVLPEEDTLQLVLEEGPVIGIRVEGRNGASLELDTSISVMPAGEASAWPAPGAGWAFTQEATIPGGSQTLHLSVGTIRDVEVSARYHSTRWMVDPDDPIVVPPFDELVFTISRSCVVDFRVVDAESGDPLPRGFAYTMFGEDEKAIFGGAMSRPGGHLRLQTGVRPGVYVFRAWATGYRPRESAPLTLATYGAQGAVDVALERDPTRGSLRVSLPILPELQRRATGDGGTVAAPAFFYWKRSASLAHPWVATWGEPGAWGGLDGDKRRESDTDYVFEGVPAGDVGLLVGEWVSGRVAYVPRITIRGGHTDTTTVDLWPGIYVDPAVLIPAEGTCRSFRVHHPVHGDLPAFAHDLTSSTSYTPGDVPQRDRRLGPYPGPEIEVEVITEDGKVTTRTFRAPER